MSHTHTDYRQRFFFDNSPVRGDVVSLEKTLTDIVAQRDYPEALKKLLGEMLVNASLLASTLKIEGRLSIQLQTQNTTETEPTLSWAMAECNHKGELRALAKWNAAASLWQDKNAADDAFAALASDTNRGVLFINIEPEKGQRYQGIVERVSNNLSECIGHYQLQSAQIPTLLKVACNGDAAGGMMLQKLPSQSEEEADTLDNDLWPRLNALTGTLSDQELLELPAQELLFRLYNEENVRLPEQVNLSFGCTCSRERCSAALINVGRAGVEQLIKEQELENNTAEINMDCQFCGHVYRFSKAEALSLFDLPH